MKNSVAILELAVWYFTCLGFALLLLRLFVGNLASKYRYLTAFAGVQLVQNLVLLSFYHAGKLEIYGAVYAYTSPFVWLTYILIVLELYNSALQRYEGIAALSRKVLNIVLVVAFIGALATLIPESRMPDSAGLLNDVKKISFFSLVERGIVSSLVVFLLLISGLLLWFPARISRNAATHTVISCVFFLGIAASLFIRDLRSFEYTYTRFVSTVMLAIGASCLILWSLLLRSENESVETVTGHAFRSEASGQIAAQQLDAINAALLRVTRK